MPLAFKNAGLILSSISLWIMAFICVHCMHILLKCYKKVFKSHLERDESELEKIGYEDVVYMVMKNNCKIDSKIPRISKVIVSVFECIYISK